MRFLPCILGCAIAIPATVAAQPAPDFSALRLKVGDTIYVNDAANGVEVSGPLKTLTARELSIDGYTFRPAPGLTIERRGDSIWNGAAWGFSLGALLLYPVVPETFVKQGGSFRINNGLMWGAIGALIDFAHKGRTTIYRGAPNPSRSSRQFVPDPQDSSKRPTWHALASVQVAPDFSTLPIKVGDTIYINDAATGVEVSGPLRTLTAAELSVDGYSFTPAPGLTIERAGDPVWDGALVGSGIGALMSITIGAEGCLHRSQPSCSAQFAFGYGSLGALIDWLHKGRTRVYGHAATRSTRAAHVVPLISAHRKGLALSFDLGARSAR